MDGRTVLVGVALLEVDCRWREDPGRNAKCTSGNTQTDKIHSTSRLHQATKPRSTGGCSDHLEGRLATDVGETEENMGNMGISLICDRVV